MKEFKFNKQILIIIILRVLFILCVIYVFLWINKFYIVIKKLFLEIFPHRNLSIIDFYQKYNCNLHDLTFLQKLKFLGLDFIEPTLKLIGIKIGLVFFLFCFLYNIFLFLKKINKKKINLIVIEKNTDLKSNLFFYHRIINLFIEKVKNKREFTFEDYRYLNLKLLENIIELHQIITEKSSKELLEITINCKNHVIEDLAKNPNEIEQFVFDKIEKRHYDLLIKVLEEKKKNNEIMYFDLNTFLEKFAQFRIEN